MADSPQSYDAASATKLPVENAETMTTQQASSGPLAAAKAAIGIWSTVRRLPPPSPSKTEHVRLITITVSHYCEKVRWVLDLCEADERSPYYYTEDAHPPGLHAYEPLEATGGKASITPMVVFRDEEAKTDENDDKNAEKVLYESSKIVERFLPSLYPSEIADRVKSMESDLGRRLGPSVRCYAYSKLLTKENGPAVAVVAADPRKVSNIESTLFEAFLPRGLAAGITKALDVNDETAKASLTEIRAVFAEASARLEANGGEYLMDDKNGDKKSYGFTAADLTFAALSYPFLRPAEMEFWFGRREDYPEEILDLSDELSQTRAGEYVLRMYKKHRPVDDETGIAVMKNADRNRTFFGWMFGY